MEFWMFGPIAVVFSLLFSAGAGCYHFGKSSFVKDHSGEPYCIEKSFGAETVKKCYIVKEVAR